MKCNHCGIPIHQEQNFCGECGERLNTICAGCNTSNPPQYKFCSQCGRSLTEIGTLLLDGAGLILEANTIALELLIPHHGTAIGKPFSIFINTPDLADFYSHWNEICRQTTNQTFEVGLTLGSNRTIQAQLIVNHLGKQDDDPELLLMEIVDVTGHKSTTQGIKERNTIIDLLSLLTEISHPGNVSNQRTSIGKILEKIGHLSAAQYLFVDRLDVKHNRLISEYKWHEPSGLLPKKSTSTTGLEEIRQIFDKVCNSQSYNTNNINSLAESERKLWSKWHADAEGSILCEMVYQGKSPAGIIGISKIKQTAWPQTIKLLLRLAGKLIAETFPRTKAGSSLIQLTPTTQKVEPPSKPARQVEEIEEIADIEFIIEESEPEEQLEENNSSEEMQIVPDAHGVIDECIPLLATPEGEYFLTCPKCKKQEIVSPTLFHETGWIQHITCTCSFIFRVIYEMRQRYRKNVQLDGQFAQQQGGYNTMASSRPWSNIEITNISKDGLNFTSPIARLLNVGELVHLQFNLDNKNKSTIEKTAEIRYIHNNSVGCQFQGSDKYDVALGFYFL